MCRVQVRCVNATAEFLWPKAKAGGLRHYELSNVGPENLVGKSRPLQPVEPALQASMMGQPGQGAQRSSRQMHASGQ